VTLGALFRVCRDPIARLRVIGALLEPPLDDRAAAGSVIGLAAPEAEDMLAIAFHCWDDRVELPRCNGALDGKFAVWSWTPLEVGIVVDVSAVQESPIATVRRAFKESVGAQRANKRLETYRSSTSFETSSSTVFSSTMTLHFDPMH
jgi:hypothetical protein